MDLSPAQTSRDRLIVALDFPGQTQALELVDRLDGACKWVKVGLELYLAAGPAVVDDLARRGYSVFLDLKLHDIPNTVAGAVRSIANLGAGLLTVHAAGGPAMLAAAINAANECTAPPKLLAVTVLTSMDSPQLKAIGLTSDPEAQVSLLAAMATASGIEGLVCSPREVRRLRAELAPKIALVVPGIRSATDPKDDQSRTATACEAIQSGASMLVVGRPITRAANPAIAANEILRQIEAALQ